MRKSVILFDHEARCQNFTRLIRPVDPQPPPQAVSCLIAKDDNGVKFFSNPIPTVSVALSGWVSCLYPPGKYAVREAHWRFTGCAPQGKPWEGFRESPDGNPYKAICFDDYSNMSGLQFACAAVREPAQRMPLWASRRTLTVKSVAVKRVSEVTGAEAKASGTHPWDKDGEAIGYGEAFKREWQSRYAKRYPGDAWCWVSECEVRVND